MHNQSMTLQLRTLGRAEQGQALLMAAVVLVGVMIFAALGVDAGFMRYQKQQMQKAADSGAIAAASAIIYGGDYTAAGKNDAAANGFTDGSSSVTVAVNRPPSSGPHSSDSDYVEVVVAQPQPTFFAKLGGFTSVNVRARAVASAAATASPCIWVLDPTARGAYTATGNGAVNSACGIAVNSDDPSAFINNNNACTQASEIGVNGGYNGYCDPYKPVSGTAHFKDPLSSLAAPDPGKIPQNCTKENGNITGGTVTLHPGTFCGGISISGSGAKVTFSPGTYILYGGGMNINASSVVNGDGVTFYNTGTTTGSRQLKAININGVSNSHLTAPTTGTYAGILFFEDRDTAKTSGIKNTINGGSGSTFDGTLYFSTSELDYEGNSSSSGYTIIIADTLKIAGTSTLGDNYTTLPDGLGPVHTAVLTE